MALITPAMCDSPLMDVSDDLPIDEAEAGKSSLTHLHIVFEVSAELTYIYPVMLFAESSTGTRCLPLRSA